MRPWAVEKIMGMGVWFFVSEVGPGGFVLLGQGIEMGWDGSGWERSVVNRRRSGFYRSFGLQIIWLQTTSNTGDRVSGMSFSQ